MIANYHSHTTRCNHAFGTEREYVEAAIENGFQIFGFSDHTPQFFPGEHYSKMRMRPEKYADYANTVLALKKEYADKLQIHLGVEVEYYPAIFQDLLSFLRDTPTEYMLLSQHWNGNEEGETYNGRAFEDEEKLERYCSQVRDAMQTGLFTYLAHPDIINYVGDPKIYTHHMRQLCRDAKGCGMPLEINFVGLRESRHYPCPLFWEIAAEEGCTAILGCDTHRPEHLFEKEPEEMAFSMVNSLGLTLLETVPLRKI